VNGERRDVRLTSNGARNLMVAAQGLDQRSRRAADKADVLATIRRMGVLQIDTIHVVARSPYLVLWSRLGDYRPVWLDELLAEGALFEYWAHEASFVPAENYALFRHRMIDPGSMGWKYSHAWIEQNRAVIEEVVARIRAEGAVRSADFQRLDGRKGGGWWGWKPEKRALEMLFTAGDVMVARRERFQRVYDLRERVLPSWTDADLPPVEHTDRALVEQTVKALGVTQAKWVPDYFRMDRKAARPALEALEADGAIERVTVEGWDDACFVHRANRVLAERAAAGRLRCTLTTVLSPFDPLVWDRARARAAFGFDYSLECYTPEAKRKYGYFVLPILRRGRLIGRIDAKAHRREGRFEVKALYLEEQVVPDDALAADIAGALAEVAAWHGTPRVAIRRSAPASFASVVRRAIRARQSVNA
jgi:hypothetical protein